MIGIGNLCLLVLGSAAAVLPASGFAPANPCAKATPTSLFVKKASWHEYKHDNVDTKVPHVTQRKAGDVDERREISDAFWLRQFQDDKAKFQRMNQRRMQNGPMAESVEHVWMPALLDPPALQVKPSKADSRSIESVYMDALVSTPASSTKPSVGGETTESVYLDSLLDSPKMPKVQSKATAASVEHVCFTSLADAPTKVTHPNKATASTVERVYLESLKDFPKKSSWSHYKHDYVEPRVVHATLDDEKQLDPEAARRRAIADEFWQQQYNDNKQKKRLSP